MRDVHQSPFIMWILIEKEDHDEGKVFETLNRLLQENRNNYDVGAWIRVTYDQTTSKRNLPTNWIHVFLPSRTTSASDRGHLRGLSDLWCSMWVSHLLFPVSILWYNVETNSSHFCPKQINSPLALVNRFFWLHYYTSNLFLVHDEMCSVLGGKRVFVFSGVWFFFCSVVCLCRSAKDVFWSVGSGRHPGRDVLSMGIIHRQQNFLSAWSEETVKLL